MMSIETMGSSMRPADSCSQSGDLRNTRPRAHSPFERK